MWPGHARKVAVLVVVLFAVIQIRLLAIGKHNISPADTQMTGKLIDPPAAPPTPLSGAGETPTAKTVEMNEMALPLQSNALPIHDRSDSKKINARTKSVAPLDVQCYRDRQKCLGWKPTGCLPKSAAYYPASLGNRAPKVAICFSGAIRTSTTEFVSDNIRTHLIHRLGADVFMYVNAHGRARPSTEDPTSTMGIKVLSLGEYVRRMKPVSFSTYASTDLNTSHFSLLEKPCLSKDKMLRPGEYSDRNRAHWPQHEAMRRCFDMVKAHERLHNFVYDWVIRARPDIMYGKFIRLPDVDPWVISPMVWGQAFNTPNVFCDSFAVATRKAADSLFSAEAGFRKDVCRDQLPDGKHCCVGATFPGSANLCQPSPPPSDTSASKPVTGVGPRFYHDPECMWSRWLLSSCVAYNLTLPYKVRPRCDLLQPSAKLIDSLYKRCSTRDFVTMSSSGKISTPLRGVSTFLWTSIRELEFRKTRSCTLWNIFLGTPLVSNSLG
jgi:hypothetical protein